MARRGDELREHMLWTAKETFLEMGFERASMDVIAARAQTSKRTLYAHFENKEKLYLAVIELVRQLFLGRLQYPGDFSTEPREALIEFCGRFLQGLLYAPTIRMCRMSVAEAERFPEGAARYFDVGFTATQERLSDYLQKTFALTAESGAEAAEELIGRVMHPRFVRSLFGVDPLPDKSEIFSENFDLTQVRRAVDQLLASLKS